LSNITRQNSSFGRPDWAAQREWARTFLIASAVVSFLRSAAEGLDSFFYVPSKVFVNDSVRAAGLKRGDHLRYLAAIHRRRFDDRNRSAVLFDHDFRALPDLLQHGVEVAGEFGLCHAYRHSICHDSVMLPRYSSIHLTTAPAPATLE